MAGSLAVAGSLTVAGSLALTVALPPTALAQMALLLACDHTHAVVAGAS